VQKYKKKSGVVLLECQVIVGKKRFEEGRIFNKLYNWNILIIWLFSCVANCSLIRFSKFQKMKQNIQGKQNRNYGRKWRSRHEPRLELVLPVLFGILQLLGFRGESWSGHRLQIKSRLLKLFFSDDFFEGLDFGWTYCSHDFLFLKINFQFCLSRE
jgi:hypothetical protein